YFTPTEMPYSKRDTITAAINASLQAVQVNHPLLALSHAGDNRELITYFQDPQDRVNRWILHILEESPLEYVRHRSWLTQHEREELDDHTWADLLLKTWMGDDKQVTHGQNGLLYDNYSASQSFTISYDTKSSIPDQKPTVLNLGASQQSDRKSWGSD